MSTQLSNMVFEILSQEFQENNKKRERENKVCGKVAVGYVNDAYCRHNYYSAQTKKCIPGHCPYQSACPKKIQPTSDEDYAQFWEIFLRFSQDDPKYHAKDFKNSILKLKLQEIFTRSYF